VRTSFPWLSTQGACSGALNIVPHYLGVETKVNLNTPSFPNSLSCLLRTKL